MTLTSAVSGYLRLQGGTSSDLQPEPSILDPAAQHPPVADVAESAWAAEPLLAAAEAAFDQRASLEEPASFQAASPLTWDSVMGSVEALSSHAPGEHRWCFGR